MNKIKKRNEDLLNILLNKFKIGKSAKELVKDYESVYIAIEYIKDKDEFDLENMLKNKQKELKRVLMYSSLKYTKDPKTGAVSKTNKREILYTFGRKIIKTLNEKDIDRAVLELKLIVSLIKELKFIDKIEFEELEVNTFLNELNL